MEGDEKNLGTKKFIVHSLPAWVWQAVLALAVLAVAMSAVYIVLNPRHEQEPNPVTNKLENWKTYRNEVYGFEFRYPRDHTAYKSVDQQAERLLPADPQSDFVAVAEREAHLFCCEPVTFSVQVVPNTTVEDWLEENLKSDFVNTEEIYSRRTKDFLGRRATEIIGPGRIDATYKLIVLQQGSAVMVINQNFQSDFLDAIFSTFKFIEPKAETIGWKTYRNEEYGF
ncbi:MAG: hypothetical protein HY397_01385, partial [Candidatus Doudnabacteria bacterium]|nr:hypothetical protein [Candidatus Doudnabacteria bacterium]